MLTAESLEAMKKVKNRIKVILNPMTKRLLQ